MVKGKVIFEDEEKIEIKYPCFELKILSSIISK